MKLLELHLLSVGPFTDRRFDFSGGNYGLHVVFGANEAGKSSMLRALRALLYGFPERTQDDFLHDKSRLRVGGHFQAINGERLFCYRRKGRKDTLLDTENQVLPEEQLTRLLGGLNESMFERLFGINHESLATGGQALLAERGREAEALFGAGLGGATIHRILGDFNQELDKLFKPKASKPLINAEIKQFTDIKRQLGEVTLSCQQWNNSREASEKAQQQIEAMDQQCLDAERQRNQLERIRRIRPGLARRNQLREQIEHLGEIPLLADDFGERRQRAVTEHSVAIAALHAAGQRIRELSEKAATLQVSETMLADADAIDSLYEQLGSHRKALIDRSDLQARQTTLEDQARRQLAAIRPALSLAEVESLRPLLIKQRRITELGGQWEALEITVRNATSKQDETARKLAVRQHEWAQLPDIPALDGLRQVIAAARRLGDLDRELDKAATHVQQQQIDCERDLAALGLWERCLADLCRAPLPARESLQHFKDELQTLEGDYRQYQQMLEQARMERQQLGESLRALQLAGAVPSEAELEQARVHRDRGWQLLKQQWLMGEDIVAEASRYTSGGVLSDTFEEAMNHSDTVADRLRREAQRVHEQATAQARLEASQQRICELEQSLAVLECEQQRFNQVWQRIWEPCGLKPQSPQQMIPWLDKALRLRERAAEHDTQRAQLDTRQQVCKTHIQALLEALTLLGEEVDKSIKNNKLEVVLSYAETRLSALENIARQRAMVQESIRALDEMAGALASELKVAENDVACWRLAWITLMRELRLAENVTHGELLDDLPAIATIVKQVDEAAILQQRINDIDADAAQFQKRATKRLACLNADLLALPIEDAVTQLHAQLGRQREIKSQLDTLQEQRHKAEMAAREAQTAIHVADEQLAELCRQAACEMPEQLEAVEQRCLEYRRLVAQQREVENELIDSGDGLSLQKLEMEAAAIDRDAVEADLATLNAHLEQVLRPQREALLTQKINADRDLKAMSGGDDALRLAEEAQQKLSSLRAWVERYACIRLASRILRDEVERFRRRHRDPMLTRASGYFKTLTCESFDRIETDFDDTDQPVLVGVKASNGLLRVEAMSTGTRDQLYLALRLAALEHYVNSSEPLPFIVDDILVQFDDDRARATLGTLADFSMKTQVILFTHHHRIIEQASRLAGVGERVFIHELG